MATLEVCIDSVASALHAERGGADRVELCDNLLEGGTTPSAGCIEVVRASIKIGLQVIIRPRGGDFLYDDLEFEMMKKDIQVAKDLGADGVVLGILTAQGHIDRDRTAQLLERARPMNVTFHRAFDMTVEPIQALEDLIELGIDRLLTSGQQPTAPQGAALIQELVQRAGNRIILMPGGGINEDNIRDLIQQTGVQECHVSGRGAVTSRMEYQNPHVYMGIPSQPEYERKITYATRIQAMKNSMTPHEA